MNDCALTPEHGHPIRVVVPGYSGVRWVKWVDRITIAAKEAQDFYQQNDYKILPVTVREYTLGLLTYADLFRAGRFARQS